MPLVTRTFQHDAQNSEPNVGPTLVLREVPWSFVIILNADPRECDDHYDSSDCARLEEDVRCSDRHEHRECA